MKDERDFLFVSSKTSFVGAQRRPPRYSLVHVGFSLTTYPGGIRQMKNVMRLAALALALVTVSTAAQKDIPLPTCTVCDGSGN